MSELDRGAVMGTGLMPGNGSLRIGAWGRTALRECGERHLGVCWTERFNRWSRPGSWVPPEYRPFYWYRLTPEGRVPLSCAPGRFGQ